MNCTNCEKPLTESQEREFAKKQRSTLATRYGHMRAYCSPECYRAYASKVDHNSIRKNRGAMLRLRAGMERNDRG